MVTTQCQVPFGHETKSLISREMVSALQNSQLPPSNSPFGGIEKRMVEVSPEPAAAGQQTSVDSETNVMQWTSSHLSPALPGTPVTAGTPTLPADELKVVKFFTEPAGYLGGIKFQSAKQTPKKTQLDPKLRK